MSGNYQSLRPFIVAPSTLESINFKIVLRSFVSLLGSRTASGTVQKLLADMASDRLSSDEPHH